MPELGLRLAGLKNINNFLTQYLQTFKPEELACDKIFPMVPTDADGKIPQLVTANLTRRINALRGNDNKTNIIELLWDWKAFETHEYSVGTFITARDKARAAHIGGVFKDLALMKTKTCRILIDLDRENRAYDEVAANATAGTREGNQWNAASGVKIEEDIKKQSNVIRGNVGKRANLMVISRLLAEAAFRNADFRAFYKDMSSVAILTEEQKLETLAKWSGIPNIFIAEMVQQPNIEGQTPTTMVDVWGDRLVIAYVETLGSWSGLSHGFTFRHRQYARQYEIPERNGTQVEANLDEEVKIINPGAIVQVPDMLA